MNAIDALIRAIQRGDLLGPRSFADISTEDAFWDREGARYEREWIILCDELERLILAESDERRLDQLWKIAYLNSGDFCAVPDSYGHISDDFGLTGKTSVRLPDTNFAAALLHSYIAGRIPRRTAALSNKPLRALSEMLER